MGLGRGNGQMELWLSLDNDDREVIQVRTLQQLIGEHRDTGKHISYLKVDIEGFEFGNSQESKKIFYSLHDILFVKPNTFYHLSS